MLNSWDEAQRWHDEAWNLVKFLKFTKYDTVDPCPLPQPVTLSHYQNLCRLQKDTWFACFLAHDHVFNSYPPEAILQGAHTQVMIEHTVAALSLRMRRIS